jgi:transposase
MAMDRQADRDAEIVGGVDTHKQTHVAAAVDGAGRLLGTAEFPATSAGYGELLRWLRGHGGVSRVGVEGTGSYGAGLARYLAREGILVVEVIRPNRQLRRRRGKSDPVDAEAAARAALAKQAEGTPKSADGLVEAMRMIRLARSSAVKARTQAANQIDALVTCAPESLRSRLKGLSLVRMAERARRWHQSDIRDPLSACRATIARLARRWSRLGAEIKHYDQQLKRLTEQVCPQLLASLGVGPEVASCLLVAAGDNPERLCSEASFAAMCGVSPLDASSGQQRRHRLNRGGNRDANRALWIIAMTRLRVDARTKTYAARRTKEGRTRREILRCLKRYIAREVYALLLATTDAAALDKT